MTDVFAQHCDKCAKPFDGEPVLCAYCQSRFCPACAKKIVDCMCPKCEMRQIGAMARTQEYEFSDPFAL
jgi:hypothetical protein